MVNGHCIRCLHAEQNAIIQGALFGVSTSGATIYCTAQPCNMCAKMIVNAGIVKIVVGGEYPDEFALQVIQEAGLELVYCHIENEISKDVIESDKNSSSD
jgi:dCMP deaminase